MTLYSYAKDNNQGDDRVFQDSFNAAAVSAVGKPAEDKARFFVAGKAALGVITDGMGVRDCARGLPVLPLNERRSESYCVFSEALVWLMY